MTLSCRFDITSNVQFAGFDFNVPILMNNSGNCDLQFEAVLELIATIIWRFFALCNSIGNYHYFFVPHKMFRY